MASTNKTTNLDLSQFINTDTPSWRQDYNGDMGKIDAAYASDISGADTAEEITDSDYIKVYDTSATKNTKTLISSLIAKIKQSVIDDTTTSADKVWSSSKTDSELGLKANKTQITNPNLLDNPWFTINQRGVTSFSDYPTNNFIVDRWTWRHFNGNDPTTKSLSVTNNGLVLSHDSAGKDAIRETLEDVVYKKFKQGELYTFSLLVSGSATIGLDIYDGSNWHRMKQNDITVSNANYQLVTATFEMWDTSNDTTFSIAVEFGNSPSITVHAAKLEKGSVSTLAQDTAPNYQQELAKCQRYFVRLKATSDCGVGYENTSTEAVINTFLSVPMRTDPTVTVSGTPKISSAGHNASNGVNVTNLSFNVMTNNVIKFVCTVASGLVAGQACILHLRDGAYIDLSADL